MATAYTSPDMLDAALNWLIENTVLLCICSNEPTTYEEAVSTYALAGKAPEFGGPFDLLNEEEEEVGRYITVQELDLEGATEGTAAYVALVSIDDLLYAQECTGAQLGIVVDIPIKVNAWCISLLYPTEEDICTIPEGS